MINMSKEPEEITEEELKKLITQAGRWSNRIFHDGRSGAALGAEALAKLLVLNFKSEQFLSEGLH